MSNCRRRKRRLKRESDISPAVRRHDGNFMDETLRPRYKSFYGVHHVIHIVIVFGFLRIGERSNLFRPISLKCCSFILTC